jgi:hypothetical protein
MHFYSGPPMHLLSGVDTRAAVRLARDGGENESIPANGDSCLTPNSSAGPNTALQTIEINRLLDRHFWHKGCGNAILVA